MSRIKASATALIIAVILFIYVYNPVEHEQHAESPTESSQMIPPAYDVAPLAPSPKPITTTKPPAAKAEAKAESKPAVKTVNKPTAKPKEKKRIINVEATFYTAKCKGCSGFTASGYDVRKTVHYGKYRIIALSKDIPLGTIVNVKLANGNTFDAIVLDRGGKIGKGKADILVASYDEAIRLGRQKATVTIIKLGGR